MTGVQTCALPIYLLALAIAAGAGIVLTVFLALTHRLPGGETPSPGH